MSDRQDVRYDRRAFILTYLKAHAGDNDSVGDYLADSATYNAALRAHYRAVLAGLERLFGARLDQASFRANGQLELFMLFTSTVRSYLAVQTPWSGFLEATVLHVRLEASGEAGVRIHESSTRIDALCDELRKAHLSILDALIAPLLGDRAELTFTSHDLRARGIDDQPPNRDEYPIYED